MTKEEIDEIIRLYKENYSYFDIGLKVGYAERTVAYKILCLKKEGVIPDEYREVDRKNKKRVTRITAMENREKVRNKKAEIEALGLHYCDLATARKCVYGAAKMCEAQGLCNYILVEKKMRGCPAHACDKFREALTPKDKLYRQGM